MKKRLTAVVLSMTLLVVNLVGCSDRNDSESSESKVTETTTTATTEAKKDTSSEVTTTETSKGDESTSTTTSSTETTTQSSSEPKNSNRVILDVKNIQQKPELPKGSEITCATMVLNYYGFNVSKMDMLKYLPISEAPDANGIWLTPFEAFIGDPKLATGYGCYNTVIKKAIKSYWRKENITGYKVNDPSITNFVDLYEEINKGNPIIIWASVSMNDIEITKKAWKTADMGEFDWVKNEHCMVLIGYDKDKHTAILSDPLDPKGTVEYPEKDVAKVYDKLNSQALVIHKE